MWPTAGKVDQGMVPWRSLHHGFLGQARGRPVVGVVLVSLKHVACGAYDEVLKVLASIRVYL